MYTTKNLNQEEVTEFFINDPVLCLKGLADYDLYNLYTHQTYFTNPACSVYQGVYEDDILIAIHKYENFTNTTLNSHLYIASKYHKTRKTKQIYEYLYKRLDTDKYKKIIVMTPEVCRHVVRYVKCLGFKEEGRLTNAIEWRQKLVDLIIYAQDITNG